MPKLKSAAEVLPSSADYDRFKNSEDQSLALPPMSKRPKGRPPTGGRFPSFTDQAKMSSGGPPKKKRKPSACQLCLMPDCRRKDRCKNREAIVNGTWHPAADLPMDPVIDDVEFEPDGLAVAVRNSLHARSE